MNIVKHVISYRMHARTYKAFTQYSLYFLLYLSSTFVPLQFGDNLRILIAAVPSKSPEEITEFYFRFINSAVQIDKTTVREVTEKET